MYKAMTTIVCVLALLAGIDMQAQTNKDTASSAENPDSPQYQEVKRIGAAADVMDAIMAAPDKGIPEEVLGSAKCIAVIPSMLNAGFVFGGRYGKGVATCRTEKGWSSPAPIRIEGGSWGLQIGGQAVDLVMLIMNDNGMNNLLSSKFKIGADVSAAAGPVGRHAAADTDWKMRAQVLNYSRARGLFAGITLNGAVIKQDQDDTRDLYGRMVPFRTILRGNIATPEGAQRFVNTVAKYAPSEGASSAKSTTTSHTETAAPTSQTATESKPAAQPESSTPPAQPEAPAAASTVSSDSVKSQIESGLRSEPSFDASKVRVTVTEDEVELTGSVPSNSDRDTAVRIAQQNSAGRRVADRLTVSAEGQPSATETQPK
jgi:lipid-binding SYLF domain-containing protein